MAADIDSAAYLELVDRVLEDRRVTDQEADELGACADLLGLSSRQVSAAHDAYLASLQSHALLDGVVTERERRDLDCVAELLGMPGKPAAEASGVERRPTSTAAQRGAAPSPIGGQSVCFTGALTCTLDGEPITRERAHQLAECAGLRVRNGVSRKLDLLIVADPDSMSGKARKAQDLGVRVIAETAFWSMIGIEVT
jgi:DNA polymerase-3 subunit epsilon